MKNVFALFDIEPRIPIVLDLQGSSKCLKQNLSNVLITFLILAKLQDTILITSDESFFNKGFSDEIDAIQELCDTSRKENWMRFVKNLVNCLEMI